MSATLLEYTALLGFAEEIWESYFGGEQPEFVSEDQAPTTGVSASVSIVGPWNGVVVVSTTVVGADQVAAALLGMTVEEVEPGDVDDAIGELVNIVGGNVKSVLPGPSSLSLPLVAHGSANVAGRDAQIVAQAALEWRGEHVEIAVWSSTSTEGAQS